MSKTKKPYPKRKYFPKDFQMQVVLERLRGRTGAEIEADLGVSTSNLHRWVRAHGKALAKTHGLTYPPEKTWPTQRGERAQSGLPPSGVASHPSPASTEQRPANSAPTTEQLPLSMNTLDATLEQLVTPAPKTTTRAGTYPPNKKLEAVRAMLSGDEHVTKLCERIGITYQTAYTWYRNFGPAVAAQLGVPFRPLHQSKGARIRQKRIERETEALTGTRVSRPSPPSSAYAERPPSRQQIVSYVESDDAETARLKARIEFLETALRKALRERNAFEVVLELERDKTKTDANFPRQNGDY
jgi:transposase-like protein